MVAPTNPVPEVLFAAGIANIAPTAPHTMSLDVMHGITIATWDSPVPVGQPGAKVLEYFTIPNPDIPAAIIGTFPGTTVRMPNGCVFHCATSGKGPPPHTIHWHGMEPTPMNDGVGHCSMELGSYTYQWQPNFIGTYFYHCHRNTMQHFEFGLYGLLLVEPADTYFATLADPSIPIGHCRDGKRRIAANLAPTTANPAGFPQFPGWNSNPRDAADPWKGDPTKNQAVAFLTDPHAQTVPYDVEGLWVFDDRDSNWSQNASHAHNGYPRAGNTPGYDDDFARNPGVNGFLAFNDYGADYWFVTGVPVPGHKGETAAIPPGIVVPAELNSGISGSQVSIEAYVGQTILIRCLDAAYNNCEYSFPVDIVIVAWDGRALGVPPFGFNEAYLVPANTPIYVSVGRRFDALIRVFSPVSTVATCKFIDTRGAQIAGQEVVTFTAQVPINISPLTVTVTPSVASPQPANNPITFTAAMTGNPGSQAPTTGYFEYRFYLNEGTGAGFVLQQDFSPAATWTWTPASTGSYDVFVEVRATGSPNFRDGYKAVFAYEILSTPATGLTLVSDKASPQAAGSLVTFTATQQGGSGTMEYRFYVNDGSGAGFVLAQAYGPSNTFAWTPAATGNYDVFAEVRVVGSAVDRDAFKAVNFFQIMSAVPPTGLDVTSNVASPQAPGTPISFTAAAVGGSGTFEYRFYLNDGSGAGFIETRGYSTVDTWTWTPAATGNYDLFVEVRLQGTSALRDAFKAIYFYQIL
ncbi:MAG: multicopper oxidase domain-containing protein [Geobacteraceae bacterium]|nr:multicopper oxidase domain-containing protein [Geobacteraceae bacterium]